jgi:L-alanine-DL-glutamate epimerase-like enolase superfamily enzyme
MCGHHQNVFEHVRGVFADVELLHDIHERIEPRDAMRLLKEVEPFRPYFMEDPVAPESNDYFRQIRAATTVPIAMGELFNSPHEWVPLIKERLNRLHSCAYQPDGRVSRAPARLPRWPSSLTCARPGMVRAI